MRLTALLGCAALLAGCTKSESPPVADTSMAVTETPAAVVSLGSLAGMWDVKVMPADRDTTLTTYVLNTTDSSAWTLTFPNRDPIPMRIVDVSGDSVTVEAGPFESNVRRGGVQVSVRGPWRIQDGKLVGMTTARYQTTGPDSVVMLRQEGTKR